MKLFNLFSSLVFLVLSSQSLASPFQVDTSVSTVSFATIKLEYVVESASISGVSGRVDEKGQVNLSIPLKNISTGIPIRNQRLNDLFFESSRFPHATVSARLPLHILNSNAITEQLALPAEVTLFGKKQSVSFVVNIVKIQDTMSVSTAAPSIIAASSFGIPLENLNALATTVGGIPISNTVPVSFSLILNAE